MAEYSGRYEYAVNERKGVRSQAAAVKIAAKKFGVKHMKIERRGDGSYDIYAIPEAQRELDRARRLLRSREKAEQKGLRINQRHLDSLKEEIADLERRTRFEKARNQKPVGNVSAHEILMALRESD